MNRRRKHLIAIVSVLVALAAVSWIGQRVRVHIVASHQRSVAKSIEQWEREFSVIENRKDAVRAVEMLRYIDGYYRVDSGYRSDPTTEAELENCRLRAMQSIVNALEAFSGETHGPNIAAWEQWASASEPRNEGDD